MYFIVWVSPSQLLLEFANALLVLCSTCCLSVHALTSKQANKYTECSWGYRANAMFMALVCLTCPV